MIEVMKNNGRNNHMILDVRKTRLNEEHAFATQIGCDPKLIDKTMIQN